MDKLPQGKDARKDHVCSYLSGADDGNNNLRQTGLKAEGTKKEDDNKNRFVSVWVSLNRPAL